MERKHFIKNLRSNQLTESGSPKLPTAEQIEYGEIAINYATGKETISLKNSDNEVVGLNIRSIGNVEEKLNEEITRAKTAEQGITESLNSEITRSTEADEQNASAIVGEKTRAEAIELGLENSINAEVTRATNRENEISNLLGTTDDTSSSTTAFGYIAKEVSDRNNAIQQEIANRNTAITNAINNLNVSDTPISQKFVKAVSEVDGKISVQRGSFESQDKTIVISNTTDGGVDFAVNIDGSTILKDGNTGKLSVSSSALVQYVGENSINISEVGSDNNKTVGLLINSNDKVLTQDTNGLLSNISISYDSDTKQINLLGKNDNIISTIDAHDFIKDGILGGAKAFLASSTSEEIVIKEQSHTFNNLTVGNHYIALMFVTTDGTTTTYDWDVLDVTNIIDVYTAGNGLQLDGHSFSLKKDANSETFLNISSDGVSVKGVQTAINTTVNNAIDGLDKSETTASASNAHVTIKYSESNGIVSITATESDIASATELQGLKDSYLKNIKINNIDGTVDKNVASLEVKGKDITLSDSYTKVEYPSQFEEKAVNYHVMANDKIDNSFNKIETTIKTLAEEVINDEQTTSNAVNSLAEAAGIVGYDNTIVYVREESCSYINEATSLHDATILLDSNLKTVSEKVNGIKDNSVIDVNVNGNSVVTKDHKANITMTSTSIPHIKEDGTETSVKNELVSIKSELNATKSSVNDSITKLENKVIDDELVTSNAISSLAEAVGLSNILDEIKYTPKDNANYIGEADNLNDAVNELDDNLKKVELLITEKLQRAFDDFCIANPSLNRIIIR